MDGAQIAVSYRASDPLEREEVGMFMLSLGQRYKGMLYFTGAVLERKEAMFSDELL